MTPLSKIGSAVAAAVLPVSIGAPDPSSEAKVEIRAKKVKFFAVGFFTPFSRTVTGKLPGGVKVLARCRTTDDELLTIVRLVTPVDPPKVAVEVSSPAGGVHVSAPTSAGVVQY
jgi:hypothetical protein